MHPRRRLRAAIEPGKAVLLIEFRRSIRSRRRRKARGCAETVSDWERDKWRVEKEEKSRLPHILKWLLVAGLKSHSYIIALPALYHNGFSAHLQAKDSLCI